MKKRFSLSKMIMAYIVPMLFLFVFAGNLQAAGPNYQFATETWIDEDGCQVTYCTSLQGDDCDQNGSSFRECDS